MRGVYPQVKVIELDVASKTAALNAGIRAATGRCVLLLDADIGLPTDSARTLVETLMQSAKLAAIGYMTVDLQGASLWVRAFYKVWLLHPYLKQGKFAAVIALSRDAVQRIGEIPELTADDTYLRRRISAEQVVTADVRFTVRAPRTLAALVHVRSRSYRGTTQLQEHAPIGARERYSEVIGLVRDVLRQPSLWVCLPVYVLANVAALVKARRAGHRWERDMTTRVGAAESL